MRWKILEWVQGLLCRLGLLEPGKVMYIGGSDVLPQPLDKAREAELIARLGPGGPEGADRAQPAPGGLYRPAL